MKKQKQYHIFSMHAEDEVRQIFVGHHTVWAVVGFSIGATLVGRTVWEYLVNWFDLPGTLIIGLVIFTVSGYFIQAFRDYK